MKQHVAENVNLAFLDELRRQNQCDKALSLFEMLPLSEKQTWQAYNLRGQLQASGYAFDDAVASYMIALERSGQRPEVLSNLGVVYIRLGKLDDAHRIFKDVLKKCSDAVFPWNNMGMVLHRLGYIDAAITAYKTALSYDPDAIEPAVNLAYAYMAAEEWEKAWPLYDKRPRAAKVDLPQWRGQRVSSLLLLSEQGFGDTIHFSRYAGLLKTQGLVDRVVLFCKRPLARLMAVVPGIDQVVWESVPRCDAHCGILDLPLLTGRPFLSLPYEAIEPLAPIKKIGVALSGNPKQLDDRTRSIPKDLFSACISKLSRAECHSLQPDLQHEGVIPHPELHDFADTAKLMADMDLVVTVDTSVAHLAGMMGVPTWVMLSACRDWHYGKSATRSPWYPTQRLFRQDQPHDWQGVFDRIGIALQPFFNAGSGVR